MANEWRTRGRGARRGIPVDARGVALKNDPILNKGSAFPEDEREALGLRGLLPPAVSTMEQQLERVHENYLRQPDDLARYLHLVSLQDRNETLFYRLLIENLETMLPIVYTPTVGLACKEYSHIYRRPRGLYITARDIDRMDEVLSNAPSDDVAAIVVTDGEAILGIGDQGVGGMGICIGKLTLYTAGAGIHPARTLPICIDVGTDNPARRRDPLYLGVRHARLRGAAYFELLDAFVDAVGRRFPRALVQWEDFARQNAFSVLERYRDRLCSFNDDVQGTGAVVVAGLLVAGDITGRSLVDHRVCVFGAGAAGGGIARSLLAALAQHGLNQAQARQRIVALDTGGLILSDRSGLAEYKRPFARERDLVAGWALEQPDFIGLMDVVRNFRPTVLIGTSAQGSAFGPDVLRQMARNAERPVVLALSNPTEKTEAHPEEILEATQGRALLATGSPFAPVTRHGRKRRVPQCNNLFCFPGIGLGTIAAGATRVTDEMLFSASTALAGSVARVDRRSGHLYPPIANVRAISRAVAQAVAQAAVISGAAESAARGSQLPRDLARRIEEQIWRPEYVPYHASVGAPADRRAI